ncbi:hypothetical protein [Pseudogracilibacillus sp. SO30301A]|uniref:hypothetical protein n=1 Tax=Pseudogracilibacillus sp. SO30301A TaxID=3098291 RepID=UPI00300DC5A5
MWLTLLASVGVGAAAFYTMSKSDQPMTKAMESVAPMLNGMTNTNSNMNSSGNTIGTGGESNTGKFGPHGMS